MREDEFATVCYNFAVAGEWMSEQEQPHKGG